MCLSLFNKNLQLFEPLQVFKGYLRISGILLAFINSTSCDITHCLLSIRARTMFKLV